MSVSLIPENNNNNTESLDLSNFTWLLLTTVGNKVDSRIPKWNGYHDTDQRWTPEHLNRLAQELEFYADVAVDLRKLATLGTVKIT